jgi:SAM-dependent methyltransferase
MRVSCFQCHHLVPVLLILLLQAQFPFAFLASPHLFWRRCPSQSFSSFLSPQVVRVASDGNRALHLHQITVDADTVLDEDIRSKLTTLVRQRADARWKGDYTAADVFRKQIELLDLPPGFEIVTEDIARNEGGGSTWKLVYDLHTAGAAVVNNSHRQSASVLNLAHAALGMVVSSSERGVAVSPQQLDPLVHQAKVQLQHWSKIDNELKLAHNGVTSSTSGFELSFSLDRLRSLESRESIEEVASWSAVEADLRGRKAADAAFWFSLAGVSDTELFSLLTRVCVKELQRFGERPSCRAKDVRGIVERLAAAGVRDDPVLQKVALQCLESKSTIAMESGEAKIDYSILLDLHSDYCSLMIWKFSTRQRKQRSFLLTAAKHWDERHDTTGSLDPTISLADDNKGDTDADTDRNGNTPSHQPWDEVFTDPTRKMVVDVGCGMGVSALGLSSLDGNSNSTTAIDHDWSSYNYVGVDLSQIGIGYAKGITRRWGLEERAAFVVDSAENLLEYAKQYPGPIELVMIQFPTPYRLDSDDDVIKGGNSQLPTSAVDGFMVSSNLLKLAADLLQGSDGRPGGKLIMQSNCEDVAVWMRDIAINQAGFEIVRLENEVEIVQGTPTRRTMNWIAMGGERALGPGWSSEPLLPRKGRTETEIACILNGTPVHRCILTVRS